MIKVYMRHEEDDVSHSMGEFNLHDIDILVELIKSYEAAIYGEDIFLVAHFVDRYELNVGHMIIFEIVVATKADEDD